MWLKRLTKRSDLCGWFILWYITNKYNFLGNDWCDYNMILMLRLHLTLTLKITQHENVKNFKSLRHNNLTQRMTVQ